MMRRWIKKFILFVIYAIVTLGVSFKCSLIVCKNKDRIINNMIKYKVYYKLMLSWLTKLEENKNIGEFLDKKGFQNVAVYGGRGIGEHLIKQLAETKITVNCIIDRVAYDTKTYQIPIYQLDDALPMVDAVIVTPIWDFDNIREQLAEKVDCPIISIKDIIEGENDE